MKNILQSKTNLYIFVATIVAGSVGYYFGASYKGIELSTNTGQLSCIEFKSPDSLSVFNSTGIIQKGSTISTKTDECKGLRVATK